MTGHFKEKLKNTTTIPDIFELVKEATWQSTKSGRAGLTCGLMEMQTDGGRLIGGLYPVGSNIIVLNKAPIVRILREKKDLFRSYTFHVLLHEYLHALGILDEMEVRKLTHDITVAVLGEGHLASRLARNPAKYIPDLTYGHAAMEEDGALPGIEMIKDFDRGSINYIS